jgi:hypothetical protein
VNGHAGEALLVLVRGRTLNLQGAVMMQFRRLCVVFFGCCLSFTIGCGDSTSEQQDADTVVETADDTSAVAVPDARARALAAKDALFEQLSARLMSAMSNGGPVAAIEVCSKEAARIAAEVSEETGVKIGRTSFKLRNPANVPPAWATSLVEQRAAEPQFVDLSDGGLGALLPIRLKPQCMVCHGPEDKIAADVLTALSERYPEDAATGFEVDDLRGWFWVEVPKS